MTLSPDTIRAAAYLLDMVHGSLRPTDEQKAQAGHLAEALRAALPAPLPPPLAVGTRATFTLQEGALECGSEMDDHREHCGQVVTVVYARETSTGLYKILADDGWRGLAWHGELEVVT